VHEETAGSRVKKIRICYDPSKSGLIHKYIVKHIVKHIVIDRHHTAWAHEETAEGRVNKIIVVGIIDLHQNNNLYADTIDEIRWCFRL
jgi:hypothetical protein